MTQTPQGETKLAHKLHVTNNVRVEAMPPDYAERVYAHDYGTPEYWRVMERQLNKWAKDFHNFLRDHRSQDLVQLNIVRDESDVCSACNALWEPIADDDGQPYCANCGAIIKEGEP